MFERLVVWGGRNGLESHRWIHRHFHQTASKMGINTIWVDDEPNQDVLKAGDTVITADIWNKHLPYRPDVDYVAHNYNGDHPLFQQADPRNLLRLQVWTYDAFGDQWGLCRSYSHDGRVLFQPWGTDLLAEEFLDPVFNGYSREAVFVGAIWSEMTDKGDLGNTSTIEDLKAVLKEHGLSFKHLTQVSDAENVEAIRSGRLAPAVAGGWQVEHGYVPCRCFKNPSYGAAMFTNVPIVNVIFGDAVVKGTAVGEMVSNALRMRRSDYEDLVRAQQRVAARYSFRESLAAISRALQEGK